MADRLNIDRSRNEGIVKGIIDKTDLLKLKSDGERLDIFMLAFALGVNAGLRTPSKGSEGFILEHVAKGRRSTMPNILSVAIEELRKTNEENKVVDDDLVYQIAEEYVNTGLDIIKGLVPDIDSYDEEEIIYHFIELIDNEYEKLGFEE